FLLTITPLLRLPDTDFRMHFPLEAVLAMPSSWLPPFVGSVSQATSDFIECFSALTLAFLCYGVGALLIWRQAEHGRQFLGRGCVWLGAILVGALYLATPALLSHDTMVYAGYGRVLAVYHANPYFVALSAFPHDPLVRVDQWADVVSFYGPV